MLKYVDMNTKLLVEKSAAAPTRVGKRWRAILAVPGQGTSGKYSEEVLKRDGPLALAPGAKAFLEHDPVRKVRDMIGTYPDGAVYEDGIGLVGELEPFSHWEKFVEEVGPHSGLSIYMLGETDDEGNVTALIPDVQNGVDMVSYPGLVGSGLAEKLYESAKLEDSANPDNGSAIAEADERKKEAKAMDAEIKSLVESLIASVAALDAKVDSIVTLSESATAASAVTVDALDVAGKLVASDLTESGRKRVLESLVSGTPVDDAIKTEKALRDEILAESGKTVVEGVIVDGAKKFSLTEIVGR